MKNSFKWLFVVGFLSSSISLAAIPGTSMGKRAEWTTDRGELIRNGDVYCSWDASKSPKLRMGSGYFTLHSGANGWIWPYFGGGCLGWIADYLQLQIVGTVLKDPLGQTVGTISDTEIVASHFIGAYKRVEIQKFELKMISSEEIETRVEFTRNGESFIYTAKMKRYYYSP